MARMGKIITLNIGKIDRKALMKYLDDSIKGMDKEKDQLKPKEYELARKSLRHVQKKLRKSTPNQDFNIGSLEYEFLKKGLEQMVKMNTNRFDNMFFLKRWFYKLLVKNYEHMAEVIKRRHS
ncbi:MAG: hypothetical protein COB02_02960 [Candidatus Cloacimonadota bacterium]|nr:MAG: hypothetical protein COB02_02960 [Candidatus Cloacimonadota bacterium]